MSKSDSIVEYIRQLIDDNLDLYSALRKEGFSNKEALEFLKASEERYQENYKKNRKINLRRHIAVKELLPYGWGGMDKEARTRFLWSLGFDVINCPVHVEKMRVRCANSLLITQVLWGQERTDNDWCDKRIASGVNFYYVASDAARETNKNKRKNYVPIR